ncbi:transposable element Tcb1 transposase [Trichonephila clavipes]|nr:transposable element Tcb1 transposase [Trichonephila clavipes]
MDRLVTSLTVAQRIEFVIHHSVSARNIRRRLLQSSRSARRPLFCLPLPQNHRCLHHQWCDERRTRAAEWNVVVFTDESRICLQQHYGRIRVWRHRGREDAEQLRYARHTSPAHNPALHLRGVGASCPSLLSGLGHSHISIG